MHRIPLERCSSLVMCNNILISDSGVSNGTSTCQIFDFYVGTSTYIGNLFLSTDMGNLTPASGL